MGVFDQAANVVPRHFADEPVALLVVEQVLAILPQTLVGVHAGAIVLKERLGHDGDDFSSLPGGVFYHVLIKQNLVGHLGQGPISHVDFGLPAGAHFVVVDFDLDAAFLQVLHHLGAQILVLIHGGYGEIALFVSDLVAEVGFVVVPRVPKPFFRIDVVVAVVMSLVEANAIEDEKLDFGSPVADIRHAARFKILLGFLGDVAWISAVGLAGHRIDDVTNQAQRRMLGEGVHKRSVGIGDQQRVALVDRLQSSDAGAVKADAVFEKIR